MRYIYVHALIIICCMFFLVGCSGNIDNVEQRDYATLMMISRSAIGEGYHYVIGVAKEHHVGERGEAESVFETDAKDVDGLMKIYREHKGKELSMSHLKVILTAVDLSMTAGNKRSNMDNISMLVELLYELDGQDEIAKTCPLLIVTDRYRITEYLRNADRPVGSYISDLVRTAKRNDMHVPGLMNYLKLMREGSEIDMYSIEKKGDDLILHLQAGLEQ